MHQREQTPLSYAKFFYSATQKIYTEQENFEQKLAKHNDKSIHFRLYYISEELKRLDTDMGTAGYAIGAFYHDQDKQLTGEAREWVDRARLLMINELIKKQPEYQARAKEYVSHMNPSNPDHNNFQFADLSTDSAFSGLKLVRQLKIINLEKFYEHQLETCRDTLRLSKEHIMLMALADELNKLPNTDTAQLSLVLRKLIVTNPFEHIVQQLLEKGADPLVSGETSGQNAIQRATAEGFPKLAKLMEEHVKQKASAKVSAQNSEGKKDITKPAAESSTQQAIPSGRSNDYIKDDLIDLMSGLNVGTEKSSKQALPFATSGHSNGYTQEDTSKLIDMIDDAIRNEEGAGSGLKVKLK